MSNPIRMYDVAPDGKRFLMVQDVERPPMNPPTWSGAELVRGAETPRADKVTSPRKHVAPRPFMICAITADKSRSAEESLRGLGQLAPAAFIAGTLAVCQSDLLSASTADCGSGAGVRPLQ